jgi:DNA polymerase I
LNTYAPEGLECVIHAPRAGTFDPVAFAEDFPPGDLYGLDTESTILDKHLRQFHPDFRARLIQFATKGYAWVLDLTDPTQYAAAHALLADPTVRFASHSATDVVTVWAAFGVDIADRNVDTLVLGKMAAPNVKLGGADLKTLAGRYGMGALQAADKALEEHMKELWKAHATHNRQQAKANGQKTTGMPTAAWGPAGKAWAWAHIPADDPLYTQYAGLDAIVARRLVDILIPATGAPEGLVRMETWLAGQAAKLQIRGMAVDRDLAATWRASAVAATEDADARVREVTGGLGASQNVALTKWITERMPWGDLPITDKGAPSLAGNALDQILARPDCPADVASAVSSMKVVQDHSNMATKMEGVLNGLDPHGIIHTSLNTLEAVTARMSSSGPNMQNFAADTRGVFVARPRHVLMTCDFDQVELRVAAGLAGEDVMIQAILEGKDLHSTTAELIGVDRKIGKMTNFLIVFGGGANALSAQAGIPLDLAQTTVRGFWEAYPRIRAYNASLKEVRTEIRTYTQRRIPVAIDDRTGEPKTYANLNYMIQSSARDLIVSAWWKFAQVHGMGDWVWMPIHDELVLEVPEDRVAEAMEAVQDSMRMEFFGVPITATAEVLRDAEGVSRWAKG